MTPTRWLYPPRNHSNTTDRCNSEHCQIRFACWRWRVLPAVHLPTNDSEPGPLIHSDMHLLAGGTLDSYPSCSSFYPYNPQLSGQYRYDGASRIAESRDQERLCSYTGVEPRRPYPG